MTETPDRSRRLQQIRERRGESHVLEDIDWLLTELSEADRTVEALQGHVDKCGSCFALIEQIRRTEKAEALLAKYRAYFEGTENAIERVQEEPR